MAKVSLNDVTNDFDATIWAQERTSVEDFFRRPSIKLTAVVFGTYTGLELPYWDFKGDARKHAAYCVKSGRDESDEIVGDYRQRMLIPSREILLSSGDYDSMIEKIIEGLPHGPQRISHAQVVRGRFGFDGRARGPDVLGREFGMTAEGVRQLESRALNIMRHPSRSDTVKNYLERRRWGFLKYLYEIGMV